MKLRTAMMATLAAAALAGCSGSSNGGLVDGKVNKDDQALIGDDGATSFAVPPVETSTGDVKGFMLEIVIEDVTGTGNAAAESTSGPRTELVPYTAGALETIGQLAPGDYHLIVSIINPEGVAEYIGETDIGIEAGEVSYARLTLMQVAPAETNGGVVVDVDTDTTLVDACDLATDSGKASASSMETYYSHRSEGFFCAVVVDGEVQVGDVFRSVDAARNSLYNTLCYADVRLTQDHLDRMLCTAVVDGSAGKPAASAH